MSINKVEIIGPGCARCKALEASTRETVRHLGLVCEITKVSGMEEILERGVMATPALAVDGKVVSAGRVLNPAEIQTLLAGGGAA